jgi:uncharacterized LabA/DUF88 family protein
MAKVGVFIDGGHLRVSAKAARLDYDAKFIVRAARACLTSDDVLFRIQYYDCEPYLGTVRLPVSGRTHRYAHSSTLLSDLGRQELVAVRKGVMKFRGWERTPASLKRAVDAAELADDDFKPRWEQKGVDLRIGLDMMTMTETRAVDMIVLITGDTDLIPAMKLARSRGLQMAGVSLPNRAIGPELLPHLDYYRVLPHWP